MKPVLYVVLAALALAALAPPAPACTPATLALAQASYGAGCGVRADFVGNEVIVNPLGVAVARVDVVNSAEFLTPLNGLYVSNAALVYGGPLNPDIEVFNAARFREFRFHAGFGPHVGVAVGGFGPHVGVAVGGIGPRVDVTDRRGLFGREVVRTRIRP